MKEIVKVEQIKKIILNHFEGVVLLVFGSLWLSLVLFKGLPVVMADQASLTFAIKHYMYPLIAALSIQMLVTILSKNLTFNLWDRKNLITMMYMPVIFVTIFLHFNFKAWTPLINPNTYDTLYAHLDALFPFTQWFINISSYLNFDGILSPRNLYHDLFVLMFFVSYIAHLTYDKFLNFRKLVMGTSLILLLGSVSYWIMPAVGPFIFTTQITDFSPYQDHMYRMYQQLINTGIIPVGYFTNAPAAMPSLHAANTFFFILMAARTFRRLTWLYVFLFMYILIFAVASGWHYFIDLPIGIVLSLLCLYIVDKVYGHYPEHSKSLILTREFEQKKEMTQ